MTELMVQAVPSGRDENGSEAGLTLRGDLDHDSAEEFLEAFRAALPRLRAAGGRVLIDCAQVRACDYSGLSALLMARREAAEIGARLVLVRLPERLAALLSVAGVSDLLAGPDPAGDAQARGEEAAGFADPYQVRVTFAWVDGVPVVTLAGQVDLDSLDDLNTAFTALREGAQAGRAVIDLSRMEFADSTLLHMLLQTRAATDLWLVGPLRPEVRLLFQTTDLLEVFRIADDLGQALGSAGEAR